jgi:tripartite-type tricarboxylate transporter receptor subunit TctC
MRGKVLAGLAALTVVSTGPVLAEDFPTRTLTMINPFAAGGPNDVPARLFAQRMGEVLGQTVIVENIGGAGGMTGSARVAKAAPDGYVFLYGNAGTHTFSQLLYRKPLYNAVTDFAPVAVMVENSKVLVARKDFPVDTLKDFIPYAKANQAKMQFGSAGAGSATHMACVLLNTAIGIEVTHIPYRGTALAMQDLMGGRIDYVCDVISTALPHIRNKSAKALALLSPQRNAVLPDLATAQEQGLPGFDTDAWNAFFLPRGTPEPVVRRLAKATSDALDMPWMRERLEGLGLNAPPPERRTPDYLAKLVPSEITKWAAPVKAAGIAPED